MASEKDIEQQPLITKEEEEEQGEPDPMSYDARKLVTFEVLWGFAGTVWLKGSLWTSMAKYVAVSMVVALFVFFTLSSPEDIKIEKFQKVSQFLKVIVGFLLSFFLSSAIGRWYKCTDGFLELFDAIRAMHMQLNCLGVPRERTNMVIRYAVISAHCLNNDLYRNAMPPKMKANFEHAQWVKMLAPNEDEINNFDQTGSRIGQITRKEMECLDKMTVPCQSLWVWITSLISRMSQDGEIPPMPTPTYGRVMMIAEKAVDGTRTVLASVAVQPPWVYVQMLAMLVTVNNLLTMACFGVTLGISAGVFAKVSDPGQISKTMQDLFVTFVISILGPFLYQALLEVGVCIAQPFAEFGKATPGSIPIDKCLDKLEMDLRDADHLTRHLPYWKQPYFKQPK